MSPHSILVKPKWIWVLISATSRYLHAAVYISLQYDWTLLNVCITGKVYDLSDHHSLHSTSAENLYSEATLNAILLLSGPSSN